MPSEPTVNLRAEPDVPHPVPARNVVVLTIAGTLLALWAVYAYWVWSSRIAAIDESRSASGELAHAVEQYATNVLTMAQVFQTTAEQWLEGNRQVDPRYDPRFVELIKGFRSRTKGLLDVRMISRDGELYYFHDVSAKVKDKVVDREYFAAAFSGPPGEVHVGVPVVSRVSGERRLPITVRMARPHFGLEVINVSVNLDVFFDAFDLERKKPNGSIVLWRTDGVLLLRAPSTEAMVGTQVISAPEALELLRGTEPWVGLVEDSPFDSRTRIVALSRLKEFPVAVTVSVPLGDVLRAWTQMIAVVGGVLVLLTVFGVSWANAQVRAERQRQEHEQELERLATIDPLTGAYNRRHFFNTGESECQRAKRYATSLSLIMFDIDRFKAINDTWGHPVGDRVLVDVSGIVTRLVRNHDAFGRLGGEEFGIIIPETGVNGAALLAERIRQGVEQSSAVLAADGSVVRFTVSLGVCAMAGEDDSFESMLSRVDQLVYRAKALGRNSCVVG